MTIDEQIKKADAKIAELEAALRVAQEHRRELVNRGNLNKQANYECECGFLNPRMDTHGRCTICGAPGNLNNCAHDFDYNPKDQ